jgi:phosphate transport system permease protein
MRGKKNRPKGGERAAQTLFFLCGVVAVGCVLGISVYLIAAGLPAIGEIGLGNFLLGDTWAPQQGQYGILPFWLTSLAGTGGALLLGGPLGVLTAVFLVKAAPARLAPVLRTAISLLAGIPSVVYGLVGLVVLVPAIQRAFGLSSGANLLAAILVLSVMILPSVIGVTETALRAVPREYEEASLALGATEMETVFRVSLPAARSGVATAVVLGVGRALGEAMAVIMVSGNVANLPGSLFTPVRLLTTAIASEMSYAPAGSLWRQALFSIGLVLFLLIMLINVGFHVLLRKRGEG